MRAPAALATKTSPKRNAASAKQSNRTGIPIPKASTGTGARRDGLGGGELQPVRAIDSRRLAWCRLKAGGLLVEVADLRRLRPVGGGEQWPDGSQFRDR